MDRGAFYVFLAALLFSMQPVFIKFGSAEVPPLLFFPLRLLGTLAVFIPLAFHFKKEFRAEARQWKKFLLPAIFVFGAISLFTVSVFFTANATLTALVTKSNAVLIPLLTAAFFIEERRILFTRRFLLGVTLAAAGVIGVVLGGGTLSLTLGIGVLLVLASQVCWSLYSVSIKRLISRKSRLQILTFIFPLAFLFSLPFASYEAGVLGNAFTPLFLLVPVASGIVLGLANVMQFRAIESKGLIVTNAFSLTMPLYTGIMGLALFGEILSPLQFFFGCILLAGAFFIIRCKCDVRSVD